MSRFDIWKSLPQAETWKVVSGVVVVGIATAVWLRWRKNQERNKDERTERRQSDEQVKGDGSSLAEPEGHKMVNLEIDPDFIEPVSEETPLHINQTSKIPKPILHNKGEKSPVVPDENVEEIGHFRPTPRDDVEMKHMHDRFGRMDSKDKGKKHVVISDSEDSGNNKKHVHIQDETTGDEQQERPRKSILHNKDEKSPIVSNDNVEILVHKAHVPQDELEKKHAHDVQNIWPKETCSEDGKEGEEDDIDDDENNDETEGADESTKDQHHSSVHWDVQADTSELSKTDIPKDLPKELSPHRSILHNKAERSPVVSDEYVEELVHTRPTPRDEIERKHTHDTS